MGKTVSVLKVWVQLRKAIDVLASDEETLTIRMPHLDAVLEIVEGIMVSCTSTSPGENIGIAFNIGEVAGERRAKSARRCSCCACLRSLLNLFCCAVLGLAMPVVYANGPTSAPTTMGTESLLDKLKVATTKNKTSWTSA